jgi:hypothetical protein
MSMLDVQPPQVPPSTLDAWTSSLDGPESRNATASSAMAFSSADLVLVDVKMAKAAAGVGSRRRPS